MPSPDPEPPSEDRDHRTVMCMQLSARVTSKELENFFGKIGQVREVKMIADKNSRKSKGIAYVEFFDEKSIPGVRRAVCCHGSSSSRCVCPPWS